MWGKRGGKIMSRSVKNEDAEESLRERLETEGYTLSNPRNWGETGVDILATKDGETFHIEVIGYKSTGPARAKDFYQVFFRAVSRLNDNATHCIIALPQQFESGLPQRAKQHRIAWKRIEDAFPELEIWLIDVKNRTYKKTGWGGWLKNESK
jgi:hypothetical protein